MFFGTPRWAVPSLQAVLASDIDVVAAVTNPDRPAGRGMDVHEPPVKVAATAAGLEVHQPARARDPEFSSWLRAVAPDIAIVVAYGKILPAEVLEVPPLGFVNLHFSLLPEYRGAAPVQRAIMDGRAETGVSVMVLTEGMDEGPVLGAVKVPIADTHTAGSLGDRLADLGAELLVSTVRAYGAGEIRPGEQDHDRATYAPKVTRDEARLDWTQPALRLKDKVRALDPAPGAWTTFRGARLKVWRLGPLQDAAPLAPGELVARAEPAAVGTGDEPVALLEAQMETKKRMPGNELLRGLRIRQGERFE